MAGYLVSASFGSSDLKLEKNIDQQAYEIGQSYKKDVMKQLHLDEIIDPSKQSQKIQKFSKDPLALKTQAQAYLRSTQGTENSGAHYVKNQDDAFTIDPDTDPLILQAIADGEDIALNPTKPMNVGQEILIEGESEKVERHTCIEGESSTEETCQARLVPKITSVHREEQDHIFNMFSMTMVKPLTTVRLPRGHRLRASDADIINSFKSQTNLIDAETGEKLDINKDTIINISYIKDHGPWIKHYYSRKKRNESYATGPKFTQIRIKTVIEKPIYGLDEWVSNCEDLEKRTDEGKCEVIRKHCLDPEKTKVINGKPLTANCWSEERVYQCSRKVTSTCKDLREKGCYQVSSRCIAYDDLSEEGAQNRKCIQWEQTYECIQGGIKKTTRFTGPAPFCLDGNCHEVSWAPNVDMAESLSKLSVMNSMKTDIDKEKMVVFKGEGLSCSRNPVGFKNCCVKKGWGVKIGLTDCNEDEKKLATERAGDKCVAVGTYCKEKKMGVCIDKRTSYCCYGTKLSRILNEQGRKMLGMNFGTPKAPNCSGFTVEEFTKLDLSKIDLSELYQDLLAKMNIPDPKKQISKAESSLSTSEKREEFKVRQEDKELNQGAL